MKIRSVIVISLILLSAVLISCNPVNAQDEEAGDGAEINAFIEGEIPSVKEKEWSSVNITIEDAFGIDWDQLRTSIPEWYMRLFWPLNPMFPQPVQRFLGYTSIRLEPEIVEGDQNGWDFRIYPNTLSESNTGDIHKVRLEAKIDDSDVDYSVVVGIKCTRIDTLGGEVGWSYIYVPIKASQLNYVKMRTDNYEKYAAPKSIVSFDMDFTNDGFYKDIFQFKLETDGALVGLFNTQALVLEPGETKKVTLDILTPETFYDFGTSNTIDVKVFSQGDPTPLQVGSLKVVTRGFYFSPLIGLIAIPIIFLIIVIYLFYFFFKKRKDEQRYGKPPVKPWTLPENKQRLKELIEKDKNLYNEEMKKLKAEYDVELAKYKAKMGKDTKEEKGNFLSSLLGIFKREKKVKEKPKKESKPEPKQESKTEPEPEPEPAEEEPVEEPKKQVEFIDTEAESNKRKRDKKLLKIKRQQEKQKRKLRK